MIFFTSGVETRGYAVGILLRNKLKSNVMKFVPISVGICFVELTGLDISILNLYTPTEEEKEEDKDTFYEEL